MATSVKGTATRTAGRGRRGSRPRWVRVLKIGFAILSIAILTVVIAGFGYMFHMLREAETLVMTLEDRTRNDRSKPSIIYAADGTKLYQAVPERRDPIALSDIPKDHKYVIDAVLAAEDRRFYTHRGVDYWALGRVVSEAVKNKRAKAGGSTLTMQLAKLLYSNSEFAMRRKLQDIAVAQQMEQKLTKEQILTLYMNTAYFGEGATGIAAASLTYFGKPLAKVTIAEAAMLARCVRRPSDQNPVRNYAKALENMKVVLSVMHEEGWITDKEYATAKVSKPSIQKREKNQTSSIYKAPYFVGSVLSELEARGIPVNSGGYTVYTTLDPGLQERAETEVREIIAKYRSRGVTTGAFVLMDRDGHILAEVGGANWKRNKFNAARMGGLQPGSSFKPFVYATALANGLIQEEGMISNAPVRIRTGRNQYWTPRNSGRWSTGPAYPLEVAFKQSINLPAINTILQTKPATVVQAAVDQFGFRQFRDRDGRDRIPAVPSLALGTCQVTPFEMAEAYSVFMTGGTRVQPYAITRVVGPDGRTVLEIGPTRFEGVFNVGACAVIDRLMAAVVASGTGTAAQAVPDAHGKTGTTNDAKDAWFCGYAQGLVGIGWIGNEQMVRGRAKRLAMDDGVFGGTITVQMWTGVMGPAVAKYGQRISKPVEPAVLIPDVAERPRRRRQRERTVEPTEPDALITTEDRTRNRPGRETQATIDDSTDTPVEATPEPEPTPEPVPPRTERRRAEPPVETTVLIDICADSGGRASAYCPETVSRSFRRGRRPARCPIHKGNGE